ncbi:hypothetical protein ACTJJ4_11035 [Microbacterium sp. 22195]|uniref:hypothetical protein n=1 Tax=Microbacterium sp. 22195 TaxID=3453891 RepID=UPI003F862E0C
MVDAVIVVPLLAFLGVVTVALVTGGVTLGVQLTKWKSDNQRLWYWNRQLVDHIYRGSPPPPPAPPAGLFD